MNIDLIIKTVSAEAAVVYNVCVYIYIYIHL